MKSALIQSTHWSCITRYIYGICISIYLLKNILLLTSSTRWNFLSDNSEAEEESGPLLLHKLPKCDTLYFFSVYFLGSCFSPPATPFFLVLHSCRYSSLLSCACAGVDSHLPWGSGCRPCLFPVGHSHLINYHK